MNKTQHKTNWQKRIEVLNIIYDDLITDHTSERSRVLTIAYEKLNFDHTQIKVLESYFDSYEQDKENIKSLLSINWTYERLNLVTKAILHTALAENRIGILDKPIIIDQALITCKKRGNIRDKAFINAILDKLIK